MPEPTVLRSPGGTEVRVSDESPHISIRSLVGIGITVDGGRIRITSPGCSIEVDGATITATLDAQRRAVLNRIRTIASNTSLVRQGRHDQAQAYYLRALEADPANAAAQAGLINGRGYADAGASESRLKSALDAQPESSALLFALGNLYARQARWSEAQQAYFRAYAAEPDNADIIFNLAVALDHLRQAKLAAQYYQMALDAARGSGASTLFERDQARARIQELRP